MKKKILSIAVVAAVAVAAAWGFNQSEKKVILSNLALDNVEVLAYGETDDEFTSATDCVAVWENVTCQRGNITHTYAKRK